MAGCLFVRLLGCQSRIALHKSLRSAWRRRRYPYESLSSRKITLNIQYYVYKARAIGQRTFVTIYVKLFAFHSRIYSTRRRESTVPVNQARISFTKCTSIRAYETIVERTFCEQKLELVNIITDIKMKSELNLIRFRHLDISENKYFSTGESTNVLYTDIFSLHLCEFFVHYTHTYTYLYIVTISNKKNC